MVEGRVVRLSTLRWIGIALAILLAAPSDVVAQDAGGVVVDSTAEDVDTFASRFER